MDSRTMIEAEESDLNPKVAEKLREDIKEIQLQLAGLEIEEVAVVNPYSTTVIDSEPELETITAEEQAIADAELLAQIEMQMAIDAQPEQVDTMPDTKQLVTVSEKLLNDIKSIPNTMAFKIGEAADLVGVKQYVLRYWESEFDQLKPKKSKNGQRIYSRRDIENAMMIKKLLYEDRFSIEGARAALKTLKSEVKEEKVVIEKVEKVEQAQTHALELARAFVHRIQRARDLILSVEV